jgi:4-alpha-glucanotransferase
MTREQSLHDLAYAAGIEIVWRDVNGISQTVSDDSLRAVLEAIGFPARTKAEIEESHAALAREMHHAPRKLATAEVNQPIRINGAPGRFKITLENGGTVEGEATDGDGLIELPPIAEAGYHKLEIGGVESILAVAPARAFTLDDVAQGKKLWGLAVQLYALRRNGDGGIGDFAALAGFARSAAAHGADAVAISPVHAQFFNDVTRFGPYAPSNRAAFNALHIGEDIALPDSGDLIDWPASSGAKLDVLRKAFTKFHDHDALAAFRQASGPGLERHALFEAIQSALSEHHPQAHDWRQWPEAYRDPHNPAVFRFLQDNAREVSFHVYLQYRADQGMREAQAAARDAGMKIGIIADLAVGTDHAGSHSWSRQDEVLRGLEIGAPPDAVNREGQSWGITAFSPRGLRNSGFAGFIEMLRHALRHAGGVRIDHVMGLARLWVIPLGRPSSEGAYLRLPAEDLMRLVVLESQRHRAVILGEDLGTLPDGYQERLDHAGISGLRLLWFERHGLYFKPPSEWTRTAVAMTSTHDLPTVAGWWQGVDIAWREKLHMAGDSQEMRVEERGKLWGAFHESGATRAMRPADEDGAAAADAACAHLGFAACTLALLPIEDALGAPEQPNLPGTIDEHPNWRRRLAAPAEELLNRPDVAARLAALNAARSKT